MDHPYVFFRPAVVHINNPELKEQKRQKMKEIRANEGPKKKAARVAKQKETLAAKKLSS